MTVYAIAMAEVQEDSDLAEADISEYWNDAVDKANAFMTRCVGDFYEIDPGDWEGRRKKLEEHVFREESEFQGLRKLECSFDDPDGALAVVACVQEVELP